MGAPHELLARGSVLSSPRKRNGKASKTAQSDAPQQQHFEWVCCCCCCCCCLLLLLLLVVEALLLLLQCWNPQQALNEGGYKKCRCSGH